MIKRNLEKALLEASSEFAAVAVLGPRQSGKTTLVRAVFPKHNYISLEDFDRREQAIEDPRMFLKEFPSESGIIIDEIASDRNITNFKVLENTPAAIDGHDGFRLLFSYTNKKGTAFKTLYYGFISGRSFFNLRYNAAKQHYFDKDISDFKKILASFKVLRPKT